jgi:hypothetical protein
MGTVIDLEGNKGNDIILCSYFYDKDNDNDWWAIMTATTAS